MKSDLERKAFQLGYSFRLGLMYGRQLALDEELKFRTLENGSTIAIKDGEVAGGAGSAVGPDKLPTFEWFMRGHPELEGVSFTKGATKYVRALVAQRGSPVVKCNGSIDGVPIVATFTSRSMEEIVSKLSARGRDALPFMFDVMETGNFLGFIDAPKESHHRKRIAKFAYFTKNVQIRGETVRVQVDVAIMDRETPPAKPYVVGIKEKASAFNTPLSGGGHSADAFEGKQLSFPLVGGGFSCSTRNSNIAKDADLFKAIPVGIRIVD